MEVKGLAMGEESSRPKNNQYKGLEVGGCLACLSISEEAPVSGVKGEVGDNAGPCGP